ncbi:MAG: STAS domain-containing protein [Ruminiclostridium sp.]|nr:STAS domain-containing protein [Ruminiclostridium sp.]
MFELVIDNTIENGKLKILLKGEVDISTAPEFKTRLYEMVGEGDKDIELFCEELSYIDSTGLGILVGALKRVKKNENSVYIYRLKENIKKLFRITGLDKVFILEEIA